ncbi:folylpolyglutamate synthase/dihydrofolate synthase family protein [uncultured Bacteroides sp.]|uniref:bifunctional folylpolyglutamate synthase/dihydrofolate synthase n=1 Tax=uncultured Bacteroides sp. TaxID=162156 RepID=UPI0025F6CF36|nr:Mur ligase family protein [uncultured Bacteroides sp.]
MDYQNTLKYLYESVPMFQKIGGEAYKPGLETTHKLDEHFGHPHRQFKTIHVAGTNGKGSCSHLIAAVLQSAGYRVGLFTSPHLIDFRERIRINGEMVPEQYVVDFVENHRAFFEPLHPSFFELTTAMAFRYFADQKVDVAIIEVGMGGRLDCTNIIHPDLSIITNISIDHIQYLGDTPMKIAKEKAGIIKPGVPVVVGYVEGAVKRLFTMTAKDKKAPLEYARRKERERDWHLELLTYTRLQEKRNEMAEMHQFFNDMFDMGMKMYNVPQDMQTLIEKEKLMRNITLSLRSIDTILDKRKDGLVVINDMFPHGLFTELTGAYQFENIFTVLQSLETLKKLGYKIEQKNYVEGFGNVCQLTGLAGRWQKVHSYPDIICDTGHNVDGIEYIRIQLDAIHDNLGRELHIVFGVSKDKEVEEILEVMPQKATYYFTKASVERALPEKELMKMARKNGLKGKAYPTVLEAVQAAKEKCPPKDFIFVGGSNFIVADLLSNRDALNLY